MTLSEMASYVCDLLTLSDDRSLELCRNFINRRYDMIYSTFPWKDAEMTSTDTLAANENKIVLPDGMDMVIAIRAGESFLDPVTTSELIQTDPGIFERAGHPTVYQELTDDDGLKKIQVHPTPKMDTPLMIVGKRALVQLIEENDAPILRGVDNVLIAFAHRDMLQRGKQYGKAKEVLEEASQLLKEAQNLETQQSNQPRQSKNLTVSGNSLSEMTDAVCARTGKWGQDDIVFAKDCLRRQYRRLWDACNWAQATVVARVTNDGSEVILPNYFDKVISVRVDANLPELQVAEPALYFAVNPAIFEQTGFATSFSYLTPVGVKFLPPLQEKLSFVSTSASDVDAMFVMGELNGSEVSETVELTGTVAVSTRNKYDTPITVAKPTTTGNVSVYGASSGALLETIPFNERERKHIRIWIQPVPDATECLVLGKRKINPLVTDSDTPLLTNVSDILIMSAAADVFSKAGVDKSAKDMRDQASGAMNSLVGQETLQGAFSSRIIPDVEVSNYDYYTLTKGWA